MTRRLPLLELAIIVVGASLLLLGGGEVRGQDDSEFRTAIVLTDHAYPGQQTATPIQGDAYPVETSTPTSTATSTLTPTPTPTYTPTPPPYSLYLPALLCRAEP